MARNGWTEAFLGELAEEITVGHVGPMATQYLASGIPFLRSKNVVPFGINKDDLKFISRDFHAKLKKSALMPGDVVIVRTGKPGTCAVIPEWLVEANCSDVVIVRPGKKLNARFLAYYVNGVASHHINAHLVGAVQQHFNVGSARQMKLFLPDRAGQDRIADILGTLDDKIELNRRMNETLEAMARRLFKSWFVDFDPVHAKAALRRQHPKLSNAELSRRALPNMSPEIAELFPDNFDDSPLGPIPKGWKVGTIGDEFTLTMGQSPPGSTYNEIGEGMPFYQGKADFQARFPNRRVYCTAPTRHAKKFDTLVSVRAPVGAINMAREDCAIGRGLASVRHNSDSSSYTYYAMEQQREAFQRFEADGTVFGSINKSNFERLLYIAPEAAIVGAFNSAVAKIDEEIHGLTLEIDSLVCVRNKLLPRLLSGDLQVN